MENVCRTLLVSFVVFTLLQQSVSQQNQSAGNTDQVSGPLADPSTTTTPSPAFRTCINDCRTVQHYNPVCGSDGVTYNNQYRLDCARQCGQNVRLVRGGACTAL